MMRGVILNIATKEKSSHNEVIFKITKRQLNRFLKFISVLFFIFFTVLAIQLNSVFIKDLLISESLILMILFIRQTKSNKIKKNKT
jgi:putative effector of murein hydrolase